MTEASPVDISYDEAVAILTMNHRPYNLTDAVLANALLAGLDAAREAGARAVVIRSGLRNFSAGGDVAMFEARISPEKTPLPLSPKKFLDAFKSYPLPIVASVRGACVGGGFELALACDFIIAAKSAKFGSVESTVGLNPLMGAIQRQVQAAGLLRAKEICMLGHRYDAETMERWNLINRVVPDEVLDEATLVIAQELAHGPTIAHGVTKQIANIAADQGVEAADAAMGELHETLWDTEDLAIGIKSLRTAGLGLAKFVGR
ncbi:Enoyl-CoA hydratase/carnithine racemase [Pseudomonas benzenivorans]|nr:enoyl-CoA hydratase/isomerase family protein [Pseudomonas benzenivorans]SDI16103.1 Enoyl-CoA hydratase/carnithine racemase [Pseudomonas benzenivorans]